jgi:hypothetical protein
MLSQFPRPLGGVLDFEVVDEEIAVVTSKNDASCE